MRHKIISLYVLHNIHVKLQMSVDSVGLARMKGWHFTFCKPCIHKSLFYIYQQSQVVVKRYTKVILE